MAGEATLTDLAERVRARAGDDLEALLAVASRARDPGRVLAQAFGCGQRRSDMLNLRDLWLVKLAHVPRFTGAGTVDQARAMQRFLATYWRGIWPKTRSSRTCPHEPGEEACAWRVIRAHAAVGDRPRPVCGPPSWQRIYAVLRAHAFSHFDAEMKTGLRHGDRDNLSPKAHR